ncbi:MAG: YdeI/OmpD-associated family protein [Myxococcales bacterium]|nr:YdeI/OmpD-associated family protein [Myxococcales bacterium]
MDRQLDRQFDEAKLWQAEGAELRKILADCGLDEERKWGKPCYSHEGKNIAIIQRMKDHLALMFFKGALLDDPKGLLVEQGPNSRSAKRLELTSVSAVTKARPAIKRFVKAAIEVEKSGQQVEKPAKLELVEELAQRLKREPKLKKAFEALTPGRRREYNLFVSSAKQAATREKRIDKCAPQILSGKGLRDRP